MLKKFHYISLLYFACAINTSFAQITTYQLFLKDSTLNLLYLNGGNDVRIKNLPIGSKVSYRGEVKEHCFDYSDLYNLTPMSQEDSVLHIYKNGKEIYKKVFTLKCWPNPMAKLGTLKDTFATVSEVIACPYLYIAFSDSYLNPKPIADLHGYNITIYTGQNSLPIRQFYKNSKDKLGGVPFDNAVIIAIKNLKKGDKFKIDEIKAWGGIMCPRTLSDMTIHIIDHH